jgi:hypothetical protein
MSFFFRKELIAKGYSADAFRKKVRAMLVAGAVDYGTDNTYTVAGRAWAELYPKLPIPSEQTMWELGDIVDEEWDWYFEEEPISFEKSDPSFEAMHPRIPGGSGPPSGEFTFKDGQVISTGLDMLQFWKDRDAKEFFRRSVKFLSRWKKTLTRDLKDYRKDPMRILGVADVLRSKGYQVTEVGIQGVNQSYMVIDPSGQTFFMKNSVDFAERGANSVGGPNREKAVQRVAEALGLEGVSIPVKRIMSQGLRLTIMPYLEGLHPVEWLDKGMAVDWEDAFRRTGADSLVDMMMLNHLSGDVDKHQLNSVYWRGRLWGADYGRSGHFRSNVAYDYVVAAFNKRATHPELSSMRVSKAKYLKMLDRAEGAITKIYDRYGAWGHGGGKGKDYGNRYNRDQHLAGLKSRIQAMKDLFSRTQSDTIMVADIARHLKW